MLSLLFTGLVWFAVVPLREVPAFGLVVAVIFQEAMRFALFKLISKTDAGLHAIAVSARASVHFAGSGHPPEVACSSSPQSPESILPPVGSQNISIAPCSSALESPLSTNNPLSAGLSERKILDDAANDITSVEPQIATSSSGDCSGNLYQRISVSTRKPVITNLVPISATGLAMLNAGLAHDVVQNNHLETNVPDTCTIGKLCFDLGQFGNSQRHLQCARI
ncbi:unnamed protein product [Protopolystoma xenopodis]|uniref:Uncharacterized protein n=1 Tax=Protopolystoma xenopodis TaxID=117903 RepID=A0A448WPX5_9PLAT|nr:unnamed protein product [Protopolystoma xenopodis]